MARVLRQLACAAYGAVARGWQHVGIMPSSRPDTSPSRAKLGAQPTASVPAKPDHGENSASTVIEAPQGKRRNPLDAHAFPDGGGSGGAEAFRRGRRR